MKRKPETFALLTATAVSALFGCANPEPITARTDATRPSIVQTSEGYDTFGRKWGYDAKPQVIGRTDVMLHTFTGTITDIDFPAREVTLQDAQGHKETFSVDEKVQRFNEAKVGDKVIVDYLLGFNAELRKPTPQEMENTLVVTEATGRAGLDQAPSGATMRQIRVVATIEALDRRRQTITVKGPRGKYFTARVADPSRFDQAHIGDTIVMTFTEASAVSLKPAGVAGGI
jgi:hypothetical protein